MRKGKKLTFLVTILCTLALLMSMFGIAPLAASATDDTSNKVTATTSATVKQGNTGYCYVYIDSLESLSSLNVAVHFDPDKVSVTSSFNSVECSLYDSSTAESYVQFSYIFDGNGEDTKTQLFYFQYKILSNAEVGGAYFDIVVSEAYDSSLNVADVSGSRCAFTIAETVTNKTCSISGNSSVSTSIKEEFELSYRLNTTGVASGSFVIRYDAELFEFMELTVGGLLNNKFYDVKTDQPGAIFVSFVGTEYSNNSGLLNVKFKTIKNVTETSQIKLSVTDFYDLDLNSIGCNGYTTNANITFDSTYSEDAPSMTVTPVYSAENNKVTLTIKLDKNSYLGAGDFVLNFNTDYFTYNSYTKGFSPTFFNVNDKKVSEGVLKFSIISLSDIMTEETVLTVTFDTPIFCNDVLAEFDIGGSGLADSMTNPILINFVDSSLSISGVGHDEIPHSAKAPTCTEIGWHAYDTCSRCDYTTYVEIPANGHSYVHTLCSVCGDKQPVYRTWDVSAAGDGSLMANLYQNVVDGGYELEIAGTGAMADWNSASNVPWYNAYRNQINYLIIENGVTSIGTRAFIGLTAITGATIPNSVETIGDYAFSTCTNLSTVNFGSSVKMIGDYAFNGCTALTSVALPNSVETIEGYAFYNCTNLSNLSMGTSVTTIGSYAFGYCSALTSITIPETVTSIGNGAFANCYLVNEINFNATAMNDLEYNNNVFFNVGINGTGIEVTIGSKVTKIPAYLFYSTSNGTSYLPKITSVAFENGSVCESIGNYAFYYADEVTSIALPNSVKSIGNYAFAYCTMLVSADVGNSLETIGSNAFYNCYALESVTIPETVTTINTYAFYNCKALTEIIFNATAMADLANNNYVFYNAGVDGDGISVQIGKNVTRIPSYLFYSTSNNTSYLPKITSVIFEDSSVCKSIGAYAFYYSKNLVEVSLPEGMEIIERSAFYYCSNLSRVMIPDTVTQIDTYAFYGCTKAIIAFESDALPTTLGSSWYSSETTYYLNVKQVAVVGDALYVIFNDNTATFAKYYGSATEYQILETVEGISVTSIGSNAFRNNTTLESVTIPDTVTQINTYAFYGCSALKSITIPKNIATIGKYAFYNCTNVKEIAFNAISMDDLAYENYVFYNNGKNTEGISVTIGAEATKIPAYLFRSAHDDSYNPKITSIVFAENSVCESIGGCSFYGLDYLTTIIIPESVTSIASHAMSYCSKLTIGFEAAEAPETLSSYWNADSGYYLNVKEFVVYDDATYVITNDGKAILGRYFGTAAQYEILEEVNSITVTAIGDYAFYQNKTLNSVEIPSNVTSVGNNAFYYCTAMTDVVLPNGLLTIGNNAFYGCTTLTTILIPETVTNIGSSAFNSCSKLTIGFASATQNATLGSSWSGDSGYYLNVKEFVVYDDATYVVTNDNTAAFGRYYGTATEYAILESVNGANVTIVGKSAFRNVSSLVNVSIPNTVTRIENYAFYYCSALESITIPENVVYIGNYAFYYTRALTEINFNAIEVNDLGSSNYVFCYSGQGGDGIKVTIGAQVTKIPNYLFYPRSSSTYLPKITEFVFEEGSVCKTIGSYTFAYNTNLSSIILPEGVEVIGSYAFANTNITTIVIPDSVTAINSYAFSNCANLATVHMPSALTTIGSYAFYNCSLLSEIVIPEGVTTIGSCAFQNAGFKLVYIYSDKIAYNANSSSACGYLLDGVSSVIIRSDIELISNFITENYTNTEAITYQGSDYVIYSVHEHSWSEYQVLVPYIACEQDGCIRYVCSDCGAYKDVTTFKHDVIINAAKEPDCTNVGWHEYHTCSKCDYTTYTEIPALGHRVMIDGRVWVDSIATENDSNYPFVLNDSIYSSTNKTDSTDSYFTITALYDCTLNISYAVSSEQNCDKIIIHRNGTIIAQISGQVDWASQSIELSVGDIVTINYHKDGSVAHNEDTGWFSFTCEQTVIGTLVPGPAEDAEPTCTEAVVCHFCQTLIKEALGHDEISHAAQAPTCTEIGWNAYVTCSRCDYTTYEEIVATGHSYSDWTETLAPTCTEIGSERRDCDNCDHYEIRDIVALGHDEISHTAQAPTCTEIGWNAYVTCSRCDYTTYVEIPSTGHTFSAWVETQAPTCTTIGTDRRDCNNCDHYETRDVAALGHDEIGHSAKEPTCTAIGWYEYVTCSRCDYTTYVERAVLGHDEINHEAKEPTCTEIGWYAYVTCSRCDYTTYEEIPAIGHSYTDKICVNCGEDQPPSYSWDISADGDGSVMAYCYALTDGNYLMEIVGSGAMKDWTNSSTPWSNIRGKITRLTIGDEITKIGAYAFSYMSELLLAEVPESVTTIGYHAFTDCKKLTVILEHTSIPEGFDSEWCYYIGYYMNPKEVYIENNSTYVVTQDDSIYLSKYNGIDASFTIPSSVTNIGDYAFLSNNVIDIIYVPTSIVGIGRNGLACNSYGLIAIFEADNLPSSLGQSWSSGCAYYLNPKNVILNDDSIYVVTQDNEVYFVRYLGSEQEFAVAESIDGNAVTHIGNYAFAYCYDLTDLTLPNSICSIGNRSFYNCTSLNDFDMPSNLQTIGEWAFWYCQSFEELILPEGLKTIDTVVFGYCTKLESVVIPSTLEYLNGQAFTGCSRLKYVTISEGVKQIRHNAFNSCQALEMIVLPQSLESIDSSAFSGCTNLKLVISKSSTIASKITSNSALGELCANAVTIVIPDFANANSYLTETYPISEVALIDGEYYIIYSLDEHVWVDSTIVEMEECVVDGLIHHTCSNCGVRKDTVIPCHDKIQHSAQAQTCTAIGWHAYETCSRCDYTTYVEIAANGHSYSEWVEILAPTCTVKGTDRRDCDNCEHYETRDIAALGHDEVPHDAKAVTCTAIGWNAYVTCTRCDYTTYAEIPATGHSYGEWVETLAPTCLTKGSERRDCKNCDHYEIRDVAALGHDEVSHDAKAVTCTAIGWNAYITCTRCDYTTYVEIPATGHTSSDWIIDEEATYEADGSKHKECTICHEVLETSTIPMLTHSYVSVITAPTCIEQGYTTHTCSDCGNSYVDDYVPATGHDYGAWIQTLAPKCEVVGTERRDCSVCDHYETRDIAATGHTASDWIVDSDATCTTDGSKHKECTVCGKTLETYTLTKLGHNEIGHSAKAPTCTEIGWNTYVTCSRCDYTTYAEIPANGHNYGTWISEISATCEGEGTLGHYHCSACGTDFDANKNILTSLVISANGHTESDWIADVQPTCTTDGSKHKECTVCEKVLSTDSIEMLGHNTTTFSAKAPTCTAIGWEEYETCSRCSYSTYVELPANGHSYGNWIAEIPATCEEEGTLGHYHCSACSLDFDNEKNILSYLIISATGHTASDWIVDSDATCTTDGSKHKECTVCEKTLETYTLIKLGHDEIGHSAKAPTCTAIGWNAYVTCSRCDYTTYVEISATGHHYDDWYMTIEPTCLEVGEVRHDCVNCDHYETDVPAALGHDEVHHDAKAATCTAIGWNAYVTCTRCDHTTYQEIEALGHDEVAHLAQAPSCTDIGWKAYVTCSRCDYSTYAEIPETGHTYGEWAETLAPTCTVKGTESRDCSACDHYETRDVDMLGHDEVHHDAQTASCTEIGWDAYDTCSRCDYTTYVEIPATGHTASDWIIDEEATYEADGSKHKECTVCHEVLETSKIPMLKHSYESVVTAPTCTEQGYTTYTCSACGDSYVDDYVEAVGHHYSEWATVEAPTCTAGGQERRDCSACDYYENRDVDVLGHDIVSHPAHPATCTEIGWNAYETCLRCDHTTYVEIPANGHSYSEWAETNAPTCTADGEKTKECSVCHNIQTEVVDALGHDEVQHDAQTASCTQIGWNDYVTCSRCDYTTYVEISMLAHSFGEWAETLAPTCTAIGTEQRDCANCDHSETRDIPALNHDRIEHEAKDATCTEVGWEAYVSCSRCDYSTYVETPSKGGHVFGEWVQTVAPGSGTMGQERRDCENCDHYETKDIAALGYLQAFVDAVADLSKDQSAETTYNELYAALQLYAKLTDEEKQEANESFLVLQAAIEAYNAKATVANDEMKQATEIAFIPISASFTFLAALWFLLKKKFWIK